MKILSNLFYLSTFQWGKVGKSASALTLEALENSQLALVRVRPRLFSGSEKDAIKAFKKLLGKKGQRIWGGYPSIEDFNLLTNIQQIMESIDTRTSTTKRFYVRDLSCDDFQAWADKYKFDIIDYFTHQEIDILSILYSDYWPYAARILGVHPLTECLDCESNITYALNHDGDCRYCGESIMEKDTNLVQDLDLIALAMSETDSSLGGLESVANRTDVHSEMLKSSPVTIADMISAKIG